MTEKKQQSDPTTRADRLWPGWWIDAPKKAKMVDLCSTFAIGALGEGRIIDACEGAVPKGNSAVIYYNVSSYLYNPRPGENERSLSLEPPAAITGQLKWYPVVDSVPAVQIISTYPDVGIATPITIPKHDGYCETFPADRGNQGQEPLYLEPNQTYGLRFEILNPTGSLEPIPEGWDRIIFARVWGWRVQLPPDSRPKD